MKSLRTVIRGLSVQLVVSHEMSLSVSMRLQYESSDPHVVRAAFDVVGGDETVEWIIGRDLLDDGLEGPVNEGIYAYGPSMRGVTAATCTSFSIRRMVRPCSKPRRGKSRSSCRKRRQWCPRGLSPETSTWTLCWRTSSPKDEGTQLLRTERLGRSRAPLTEVC